jgi:plastocyanin
VHAVRFTAVALLAAAASCAKAPPPIEIASPSPTDANQVVIYNFKFKPQTITVPVGATVTWINKDATPHTATHRSFSDEPFDSGDLQFDQTFAHTFHTAGTYDYLCVLHQGMRGTVIVK